MHRHMHSSLPHSFLSNGSKLPWWYRLSSGTQLQQQAVMPRNSTSTGNRDVLSDSAKQPNGRPMPGAVLELECSRLALEGKGVCLLPPTSFVVLCNRALPGERLLAEIIAVKKGFAEARKLQTLAPHRHAVPAPCPHFGPCGGCSLQSLAYEAQLQEKQNQVIQTLKRVGKLSGVEDVIKPIIGCNPFQSQNHGSDIFGYRNKLQFTFSSLCWEPAAAGSTLLRKEGSGGDLSGGCIVTRPVLGFLRPGSQTEVLPITKCWLQDDTANTILEGVRREALEERRLLPYNDPSGKGFLKHLVIRSSRPAPPSSAAPSDTPGANLHHHHHQQQQQQQQKVKPGGLSYESGPGSSQQEKEYLVTFVVTSRDAVAALQPVADSLVASIPQVIGVVVKAVDQQQVGLQAGNKAERGASVKRHRQGSRKSELSKKLPRQQQAQKQPSVGGGGWSGRSSDIRLLAGSRAYLVETMRGLQLRVSPDSFLQTNTAQAEVLYKAISDAAQLQPSDSLLDLYCGAGSIGLSLAQQCAHVVGYEAEGAAIADAHHNAAVNGVHNTSFACVDLTTGVPDPSEVNAGPQQAQLHTIGQGLAQSSEAGVLTANQPGVEAAKDVVPVGAAVAEGNSLAGGPTGARAAWLSPDVIVCDPARAGLSSAVVDYLRTSTARRCVYVSCNPATQARDLALLCSSANEVSDGASRKQGPTKEEMSLQRNKYEYVSAGRRPSRPPAFRLVSLQAVDMFPHTDHVETLAVLDRCC